MQWTILICTNVLKNLKLYYIVLKMFWDMWDMCFTLYREKKSAGAGPKSGQILHSVLLMWYVGLACLRSFKNIKKIENNLKIF